MNVSNRFICEISTSTEIKSCKKKPARVATISETKTKKFKAHFAAFIVDSF